MANDSPDKDTFDFLDTPSNDSSEYSVDRKAPELDQNMLALRIDTEKFLKRIELTLRNQYLDPQTGKHKQIPDTTPLMNEQGIAELMGYIQSFINTHTVMGYTQNHTRHLINLQHIADSVAITVMVKRIDWNLHLHDYGKLCDQLKWNLYYFLSRTIENTERIGLTEGFKETVSREIKPQAKRQNPFNRFVKAFQN